MLESQLWATQGKCEPGGGEKCLSPQSFPGIMGIAADEGHGKEHQEVAPAGRDSLLPQELLSTIFLEGFLGLSGLP